jgi:hypothetical protein
MQTDWPGQLVEDVEGLVNELVVTDCVETDVEVWQFLEGGVELVELEVLVIAAQVVLEDVDLRGRVCVPDDGVPREHLGETVKLYAIDHWLL